MDRCEDIEVHPETGQLYAALTNNENHGNFYGQIVRLTEKDNDPEAKEFAYEVFAAGGPQAGFASPDNLMFDALHNLWVITDMSSDKLNAGIYSSFKNNGAFVMPSGILRRRRVPVRQRARAGGAYRTGLHPGRQDPLFGHPAPR